MNFLQIPSDPELLIKFIGSSGYFIMYILMSIEGPLITLISAFGVSFGYFNIWMVILLSILGNFTGDTIHFLMGRGIGKGIRKYNKGIKAGTINNLREKIHKNLFATILTAKIASPLAGVTIAMIGTMKEVSYLKFMKNSMLITIPLVIIYAALGYFFGTAIKEILQYIEATQIAIVIIIVSIILIVLCYKILLPKLVNQLKK